MVFGDFTDEISNVGCKERINNTRNKPVGFSKQGELQSDGGRK